MLYFYFFDKGAFASHPSLRGPVPPARRESYHLPGVTDGGAVEYPPVAARPIEAKKTTITQRIDGGDKGHIGIGFWFSPLLQ